MKVNIGPLELIDFLVTSLLDLTCRLLMFSFSDGRPHAKV